MAWRPPIMKHRPTSRRRRTSTRSVLRLLDLEHSKTAVLNSLTSQDAQRGYRHAIDEFVDWYCSEPRLELAPGTINLRLGAVRRLAYEAADCGLLSADLAAGIRRVKGVKKLGMRLGNWLTAEQGHALWQAPDSQRLKGKRDRALLALLLACGLRRHEAVTLTLDYLQHGEDHWAIVDSRLTLSGGLCSRILILQTLLNCSDENEPFGCRPGSNGPDGSQSPGGCIYRVASNVVGVLVYGIREPSGRFHHYREGVHSCSHR